jgi:hypothetical protein
MRTKRDCTCDKIADHFDETNTCRNAAEKKGVIACLFCSVTGHRAAPSGELPATAFVLTEPSGAVVNCHD